MADLTNYLYQEKLTTADEAVKVVKSGDRVLYGEFALFPEVLDEALARRVDELYDVYLFGVSFPQVPKTVIADTERRHFILNDYHMGPVSRSLHDQNLCNYVPNSYGQVPRIAGKYLDCDVILITTGPMDARGFFNIGLANSVARAFVAKAKTVIVEVNNNIPTCLGGNSESIHLNQVDYIVEGNNHPLLQVPPKSPSETDTKIAEYVLNEIEDGACLQLGIGGLPNAIGAMIADSDLKDLGIHSEMMMDAFVDLYEKGRITGARKNIDKFKMVYTFALGTQKLYDFLDDNPLCASYPVNYTNDPRIMAINDKLISVNNALEVDLYSQVSSESIGSRQISGTGGQYDFVYGAFNSHGGKGLICLSSSYVDPDGNLQSRIRPSFSLGTVVTIPRSMVHYIVTEYGVGQFKGKSTWHRAEELVRIAHPMFRDELIQAAEKMKIWSRSNKIEAFI